MYKAIPIEDYYVVVGDEAKTPLEYDSVVFDKRNIIAQSKPVHEGIPLFDVPKEWGLVDVEELAFNEWLEDCRKNVRTKIQLQSYDYGFKLGYLKHAETHKWTDEDMQKCFMAGAEFAKNIGLNMINPNLNLEEVNFFKYSQSLKKPKVYEVQIEMEEVIKVISESENFINEFSDPMFHPKITNNKINILSWKEI